MDTKKDFGLYSYSYKSFKIDDTDSDTDTEKPSLFDSFATSKKRTGTFRSNSTSQSSKRPKSEVVVDLSDDDDDSVLRHNARLEEEEDDMLRTSSIESAKRIGQSIKTQPLKADTSVPSSVTAAHDALTEHLRRAREYYEKCRNLDRVINVAGERSTVVTPQADVFVSIPLVKTAAERAEERRRHLTSSTASAAVDLTNNNGTSPAVDFSVAPERRIKLKTRLNGQHEWLWKISRNDPFLKLKEKYSSIYGLGMDAFHMRFDNEILGNNDTPDSLDLEDDDLIEVKLVQAAMYQAAVAAANAFKAKAATPAAPSAPPSAAPYEQTAQITPPSPEAMMIQLLISKSVALSGEMTEVGIKAYGNTTVEKIIHATQHLTSAPTGHHVCGCIVKYQLNSNTEPETSEPLAYDAAVKDLNIAVDSTSENALMLFAREAVDLYITLSFADDGNGQHPIMKVIVKPHNTWQEMIVRVARLCNLVDGEELQLVFNETILDPHRTVGDYDIRQGCSIVCSIIGF